MSGVLSWIYGAAILTAILVAGFVILWLVFGHRKNGEDQAVGILRELSFFRGTTGPANSIRR